MWLTPRVDERRPPVFRGGAPLGDNYEVMLPARVALIAALISAVAARSTEAGSTRTVRSVLAPEDPDNARRARCRDLLPIGFSNLRGKPTSAP